MELDNYGVSVCVHVRFGVKDWGGGGEKKNVVIFTVNSSLITRTSWLLSLKHTHSHTHTQTRNYQSLA